MKIRGINTWLALLTLCVIFAATAGVRETLTTRTSALRQTMAAVLPVTSAVTVSGSWAGISAALTARYQQSTPSISEEQASEITDQLRGDLSKDLIPLTPASTDWTALTTQLKTLAPTPRAADGTPVELEIAYRQPLSQHVRLVSGTFPVAPQPAPLNQQLQALGYSLYPVLQILVTERTAAKFGLKPGSKWTMPGPELPVTGGSSTITLEVSGIVTPAEPNSAFWASDPTPLVPSYEVPLKGPPYWLVGALAAPGEGEALQADFGSSGINVQWTLPIAVNELNGGQAQPLNDALTGLSSASLPLSGDVAAVSRELTASSPLVQALTPFIAAAQSADVLLWMLYVSLTVTGLVVLLLAGRMVVLRRSTELGMIRARGASLWRLARIAGGEAALACVPAAVVAVALAVAAVPGAGGLQPTGATSTWWWPVLAVLLVAVCGPALMAVWRNRTPRRRTVGRRQQRTRTRPVVEVTLILAAVGGIVIFRQQGLQPGSGVNLYSSATPTLIAIPAVIVVFRVYPIMLRFLLRAAARTSGAPGFLGLARAARTALTPALPAFALVLALTIAAFGGMVRDAIAYGEVAASWQTVGGDAAIMPPSTDSSFTIPPATASAIAHVPGVTHAAEVWEATWSAPNGTQVAGFAVAPAAYAVLVTATEGYPAVPAGALATPGSPGAPQPVLASPSAAAALGNGTVPLTPQAAVRPVRVRIAGTLSSTPAASPNSQTLPANPSFIIMPFAALKSAATPPVPVAANEMLLTGPGIDRVQLTAAVGSGEPGGILTFRSDVLAGLTDAPLQRGAVTVMAWAIIAAAVLGLAVMLLELALGAVEREATLARLATMGLGEGQRARVVALELLPAVIAAAVTAWACALALPPLVRPAIDLSVFTGSSAAVPLVPNVIAVALPLVGLLVLAAVSLAIEIGTGRRGVASSLRIGG